MEKQQPNENKKIIPAIIIVAITIIIFIVFLTVDFTPAPDAQTEKQSLTSQERMRLLEESLEGEEKISSEERLRLLENSREGSSLTPEERLELLNNN